ncbi:MAG: hypothetical protein WC632_00620 [Candidatus Margulisiibacteriota bacterium]
MNNILHLFGNKLFTSVPLIAGALFLGAMVVMMAFLLLAGYHATALTASHKPRKSELVFSLPLFLASISHNLLGLVKYRLGNNWLVVSFMIFPTIEKGSVIKGFL